MLGDIRSDIYIKGMDGVLTKLGSAKEIDLTPSVEEEAEIESLMKQRIADTQKSFTIDLNLDVYADLILKRLVATLVNPKFGNNNWRKHHGLPMWRK